MSNPSWANRPSRAATFPRWPVLVPRNGKPVVGIIYNDSLTGAFCHWLKMPNNKWRDQPCFGTDGCPHCPGPVCWKGYVPIINSANDRKGIVQFSENVFYELREQVDSLERLRGIHFTIKRRGNSRGGEVFLESITKVDAKIMKTLPEPVDIRPFLMRLWGFRQGVEHKDVSVNWSSDDAIGLFDAEQGVM